VRRVSWSKGCFNWRKLPDAQKDSGRLRENLFSPQLQEAMDTLDKIVYSEDCVNIFKSFGIWDEEIFKSAEDRKSNKQCRPSSR
jgi:hypothetical protein